MTIGCRKFDVPEWGRPEGIPFSCVASHTHAAEVIMAARTISLPGSELSHRHVAKLVVSECGPIVTRSALGGLPHEAFRALKLDRRHGPVIARQESVPRRIRERKLGQKEACHSVACMGKVHLIETLPRICLFEELAIFRNLAQPNHEGLPDLALLRVADRGQLIALERPHFLS